MSMPEKRISIRSIKLASKPRSLANEITVEFQIHVPDEKYVGVGKDGKHKTRLVNAIEYEGVFTLPISGTDDIEIITSMFELKCQCEKKLSNILNIPLDENHPSNVKD